MAGRFSVTYLAALAAFALLLGGATVFSLPLLAESRLRAVLRDAGFPAVSIGSVDTGLGAVSFRNIALDPESLSVIGAIDVRFSLWDLVLKGTLRDIRISNVTLTAEYSTDSPGSLSGWTGSFTGHKGAFSGHDGSFTVHDLPFEHLAISAVSLDIATDAGGIGVVGDAEITKGPDGSAGLLARIKGAQYQASFDLSLKGALDPEGNWSFSAEIADGKIALDPFKINRISGQVTVDSGKNGAPSSLSGQIAAGRIADGLIQLQEMTATLAGSPEAPKVTVEGRAAGVSGLSFRVNLPGDGSASADLISQNPGDLAEYLRLAGKAANKPLDPAMIPQTFSGLSLRIIPKKEAGAASSDAEHRFSAALSNPEKTLSLRSDLQWNATTHDIFGIVETSAIPATLVTHLFPSLLPEGWGATGGNIEIGGQFSSATDKDSGLKISGPIKVRIDDVGLESADKASVSGLSGKIVFDSLYPLATRGFQDISAAQANIGLPLESVQTRVNIGAGGVIEIRDMRAQFAGGSLSAEPFRLGKSGKSFPQIPIHVRDVDLEKAAQAFSARDLKTRGMLDGDMTLTQTETGQFSLRGKLTGRTPGGLIRYDPQDIPAFLSGDDPGLETTRLALRNFQYNTLSLEFDGPLDGDLKTRLSASGTNPDAFGTRPVELNLAIEGAIAPLLRLSSGR